MFVRVLLGLVAGSGLWLAGCQTGPACPPQGPCEPTVAGSGSAGYADYDTARLAFTRTARDGSLSATLEDVAWLRFKGSEEELVKEHRPYFEQGYTTFEMLSLTKDFVQPTTEVYVLTDSSGARVTARPTKYTGSLGQEQERYAARYTVSFRHAITRDLAWIRLLRPTDGSVLEWSFPGGGGAPVAAQPQGAVPPPAELPSAEPLPHVQPAYHPRNPAPVVAQPAPGGTFPKPVNLATRPTAAIPPALPPPAAPPPALPPPAAPPPPTEGAPASGIPPAGALPPPESRRVAR